jgi:microcystin-dependent protein
MAGQIGLITTYASTMVDPITSILTPPEGWLICDGRSYSKTTYSGLYRVLLKNPSQPFNSTTNPLLYGGNDTEFNVPNFTNRFVTGWSAQNGSIVEVGTNTQESVNLANIDTQINTSLTYGNNIPYYISSSGVGQAGRHNHRYATSSATDTGRAELSRTQGFFHRKNYLETQDTVGTSYWTHFSPINHGGVTGEPCGLSYNAERMWSISQQSADSILEPFVRGGDIPDGYSFNPSDEYKPFRSETLFGGRGYPYGIPSEYGQSDSWKWGNRNFRHNHKYNLVTSDAGGHTHSVAMETRDSHTHTVTTTPSLTKVGNSVSNSGLELRPANTKIVYIIYTGVK